MDIKLEAAEVFTMQTLQDKAKEAGAAVQAYATLLSNKYQLLVTGKYELSPDFTTILDVTPPVESPIPAPAEPVPANSIGQ